MKLLLFTSCIVLFGCSESTSNSVDDPLQQIQQEIKQLKINDEALEKDYNEKIKSLVKKYEDKITNYDEKIESLQQQLRLGRNVEQLSGELIVPAHSREKGYPCG